MRPVLYPVCGVRPALPAEKSRSFAAAAAGGRDGIAEPSALQCGGSGADAAAAWRVKGGGVALRVREGDLIGVVRARGAGGELVSHSVVGHAGKPTPETVKLSGKELSARAFSAGTTLRCVQAHSPPINRQAAKKPRREACGQPGLAGSHPPVAARRASGGRLREAGIFCKITELT